MRIHLQNRCNRGQSLAEMAVALPFLILLVLVVVEVSFFAFAYLSVLEASREGARLGGRGAAHYNDSEIQTLVEQDLARQGRSEGLADIIIVRAHVGPGVVINSYGVASMLGSGRQVELTQATLLSRLGPDDPVGRLIGVEIYYDHDPIAFDSPITIHTYSIMQVVR